MAKDDQLPPKKAKKGAAEPKKSREGEKKPKWTPEEDERLKALVAELGEANWREIAARLNPGRSATAVEQHYNILIGKRKKPGVAGPRPNQDGSSLGLPGGRSMGPATDHASGRL